MISVATTCSRCPRSATATPTSTTLLPWGDITHILNRGPVPVSAFRDPDVNPVVEIR